jgi:predicted unusual protein kinase regulating ubiquinone biosynthesis (AarF/ABC1/UbiB family)
MARSFKSKEIVLTHGDLHAGNMAVREDGTVILLDWGNAGFYPDYWEFYRATFNKAWRGDFLRQIERFIPPFYVEALVMRQLYDKILG